MAGFVEGALVGYAFTMLLNAIHDGLITAKRFKPILERMESKITSLKPEIEEREKTVAGSWSW